MFRCFPSLDQTFRPRRAWWCLIGLVLATGLTVEHAQATPPLTIAVRGAVDPNTGDMTRVESGVGTQRVNFGRVANHGGLRPNTGAQIDDSGTSWYVATMELTVVRNADNSLRIQSVRRPPPMVAETAFTDGLGSSVGVSPPMRGQTAIPGVGVHLSSENGAPMTRPVSAPSSRGQRMGGIYIPSATQTLVDTSTHVDLYVRLDGHEQGAASVWFSSPQHGGVDNAVELMFAETLVASNVPIGEAFLCQVSFKVPPAEWGEQAANIRFSARPAGR